MKTKFEELIEKIEECKEFAEANGLRIVALTSDDVDVNLSINASVRTYAYMLSGLLEEHSNLIDVTKDTVQTVESNKMYSKYKRPVFGRLAIVWDDEKEYAQIAKYEGRSSVIKKRPHQSSLGFYENAILFESEEQYKKFIKS